MMLKARLYAEAIKYATYILLAFVALLIFTMGSVDIKQMQDGIQNGSAVSVYCRPSGKQITVDELNQKLKGKGVFEGEAAAFINAANKYHVDPVLVAAIALHETGQGKSRAVREDHNPGGLMGTNGLMKFPTLEDGIDKMTSNLYNLYISKGLTTPALIGPKYAPIGAANDPLGLNVDWVSGVTMYVNQLGGLSYECTQAALNQVGNPSKYGFIRPVAGEFRITSPFGIRWGRMHEGIDIACTEGQTPILAAKSGTVVFSGFGTHENHYSGYGNVVVIDHGGGFYTLYAHLSSLKVDAGQTIGAGQPVGICGSTGHATGAHLHFEVKIGGQYGHQVDPQPYLP